MTTTKISKRDRMYQQIDKHGRSILAIFPACTESDPVALCKLLRRFESRAERIALQLCNGPQFKTEDEPDRLCDKILDGLDKLLGFRAAGIPIFINRDPRGYSLKIDDEYVRAHSLAMHTDWGGYGIIAPDFNGEE
jgi:hypothetical protein